jgi:hypothetical protein
MSKSYRIRTTPGVDKSINILLDQEFEYLEILSLKLLQSEIYTRQCSDYGVIVGRVSVNNGFGIPNAKVSVFIPLDNQDSVDPVVSDLYPYKTLSDINEDGYRYNLLPYRQSHSGHNPTGTFFDREDVLTNPTLIEVFDKYYKYTATTNESGDYMIFGVPAGSQTVVLDVDLSDIGEFSLSPQDLIRMGVATESQVSGVNFKSSTNLRELPQIININRVIQVEPLWGQPEICNLGITRTDFDLTTEANIEITPTAVFMGSIISSTETSKLRRNCKPSNKLGYLCNLTTNSGEILAIRQTIFNDNQGRPVLEEFQLEQGGEVIDENGTWLIDVPMNLDFVTTNEFGEQVFSNDPKVGIPTKGKYRFKVKWGQSPTLSDSTRRGYFLVPNVREYGWNQTGSNVNTAERIKSYSFSLSWDDYSDNDDIIKDFINCEDKFYIMQYNKVYTVSQFIDSSRRGSGLERYVGIKNILDTECESVNNRFPTNDGNLRFDILYILFSLLSLIFTPIFFGLVFVLHILYFLIRLLRIFLPLLAIYFVFLAVKSFVGAFGVGLGVTFSLGVFLQGFLFLFLSALTWWLFRKMRKIRLRGISIPLIDYPDCKLCDCKQGELSSVDEDDTDDLPSGNVETELPPCNTILSDSESINPLLIQPNIVTLNNFGPWRYTTPEFCDNNPWASSTQTKYAIIEQFVGLQLEDPDIKYSQAILAPVPKDVRFKINDDGDTKRRFYSTLSLPLADRINLFNTKAKYFDSSSQNPGGGVNRISVNFQPTSPNFHLDNVIVLLCDEATINTLEAGKLISFQNPSLSGDINVNGIEDIINEFGNTAITGTTQSTSNITVTYANPSGVGGNLTQTYNNINYIDYTGGTDYHKFPTDIEYFQVITGMTYSEYQQISSNQLPNSFNIRILNGQSQIGSSRFSSSNNTDFRRVNCNESDNGYGVSNTGLLDLEPVKNLRNYENLRIVILNRGVDPYSPKADIEYGLGRILGYNNINQIKVRGNYRLNISIQGGFRNVSHSSNNLSNTNTSTDTYSSQRLYYNSYFYTPSNQYSGFSSNLISYYSNLDSQTPDNFKPICGENIFGIQLYTTRQNGVIKINSNNDFTKRLKIDGIIIKRENINQTTNRNEGYFINEIVEGGSAMGTEYSKRANSQTFAGVVTLAGWRNNTVYLSPIYNTTGNTLNFVRGSNNNQIVMRSDRLPTSTTLNEYCCNGTQLQKNDIFSVYEIPDEGVIGLESSSSTESAGSDNYDDFREDTQNISTINNIINSFECEGSAPLECYYVDNGSMLVKPKEDGCYRHRGRTIFKGGCYILITKIFASLPKDLSMVSEWISRNMINLGACRNVFSHRFNDNWINGSLFAFPFANDVTFTSPTSANPNQPISNFCRENILLHPTNNFYYRSTPYYYDSNNPQNSKFVGSNKIKYPTTIMDLGPINIYVQELVMSDDYDGYVVNKLNSTTYGDVNEILNLFIISRQVNDNFLKRILGPLNILGYFSRTKRSFDGDYSQLISINSELGVAPFQVTNYPDNPPGYQNPIFFNDANSSNAVIGIFFSSNTQTRDYVSPKRQILNPFATSVDDCSFNNINVFSQKVPMYQWEIKSSGDNIIFGTQKNDWAKNFLTTNTGLFSIRYQDLDRLNPDSRYFRTNGCSQTAADVGHIYSLSGCTLGLDIDESINNWEQNTIQPNWITVGAPFHFYFGLRRGASAFDRFRQKWINTEIIIN